MTPQELKERYDRGERLFEDADLQCADLSGLPLDRVMLIGADVRFANLTGASLVCANFSGANLRGSALARVYGAHADFRDASANDVSFSDAHLDFALMDNAILVRASFTGASLNKASFVGANLTYASFGPADLRLANFSGANLSGVDLRNARIAYAKFHGAILDGAQLPEGYAHASIGWTGHGVKGRTLRAVRVPKDQSRYGKDNIEFSCGCFYGREAALRAFIERGDAGLRRSRTIALETLLSLLEDTP